LKPARSSACFAMHEEPTTTVIQRYLDVLRTDLNAKPIVRELLERGTGLAVGRLWSSHDTGAKLWLYRATRLAAAAEPAVHHQPGR
jgi:hypothetical protein